MRFSEILDENGIQGEVGTMPIGRLFTETMYNGKYHFSQVSNTLLWSLSNNDFNIVLCVNGNNVELFNIDTTVQGTGLGTEILNMLLDAADQTKVRINLSAVPTLLTEFLQDYHFNNKTAGAAAFEPIKDELTVATDRLINYYETLGFVSYGKKFQMIYVPQK